MGTARNDMTETATARSNVYGLLANVFRAEPTVALIREMQSPGFAAAFSELGLGWGNEFLDASPEQLAEDLALEYTRLFIGPGHRISPHESLHVELGNISENAMWGPQTVEVKRFIEATGLEIRRRLHGSSRPHQRRVRTDAEAGGKGSAEPERRQRG